MIPDFLRLLRTICEGDEPAWRKLENHFIKNDVTEDEQVQIHIYFKQMSKRYLHAVYIRALLYERGYGIKPDVEMTFILMREAAAKGHVGAIYEVGRRFMEGIGIERHYGNALQWLMSVAVSPHYHRDAMRLLGQIYEQGLGVAADAPKAQQWFDDAKRVSP